MKENNFLQKIRIKRRKENNLQTKRRKTKTPTDRK